jgi:hypothetical protein
MVLFNSEKGRLHMKKAIIFTSILTALTNASAFAETGDRDYSECGAFNRPIRVLNAESGKYETIRARTDRGWCQWSDGGIADGSWESEGGEQGASESSDSSTSGADAN